MDSLKKLRIWMPPEVPRSLGCVLCGALTLFSEPGCFFISWAALGVQEQVHVSWANQSFRVPLCGQQQGFLGTWENVHYRTLPHPLHERWGCIPQPGSASPAGDPGHSCQCLTCTQGGSQRGRRALPALQGLMWVLELLAVGQYLPQDPLRVQGYL